MASEFDPGHGRPHSAPMSFAFDTLAAASAGDRIARPELEDALYAEIELLWTEYAQEEPHRLSPAALALRNVLLSRFRESRDDS